MNDFLLLADFEGVAFFYTVMLLVIYAFIVFIALLIRAFRSWIGLLIGFTASAIASSLVVLAYMDWKSKVSDYAISKGDSLLNLAVVLLVFVWATPFIQYLIIRRSSATSPERNRSNPEQ